MSEIKTVAFDKTEEAFEDYGDRGLQYAIDKGRMTEEDGQLIRNFIRQLKSEKNIGVRRAYKLKNALTNSTRFFKTPFRENTIFDLYEGFENLKRGKKVIKVSRKITLEDGTKAKIPELIETDDPLSQNTIRDYQMFVKRFYLWLIDEGLSEIPRQKVEKIQAVKQNFVTKSAEDLLTEEQIQAMLNAATTSRDRAIIATLYEAALRIGEIGGMVWEDVDFSDKHFCTIHTDFKTGADRYIPVHIAREYLLAWKNDYPGDPSGKNPVFVSRYNTSLKYSAIKYQLNVIAERAGIEKHITPHIFRHSRITHMIKGGWTDSSVKSIAWGNLETGMFRTYVHLTQKDILNEARRQNGIEAPEEESTNALKPRQCGRCLTLNSPTASFCQVCGESLTLEIALELQGMKDEIHQTPEYQHVKAKAEQQVKLFS